MVAYCADPQETVHLIRKWNPWVVMGNCEQALSFGKKDCGCGFDEGSACDTLSKQWFSYVDAKLGADNRQWMKTLPQTICFEMAGKRIVAIHGGVDDISRFIFSSTPMDIKVKQAHLAQADVIIAGHCGLPFTQILDNGVIWHNAGVIGMPANDGTPDGWYALLTPNAGKITITHHRLSYEHTTAALRMRSRSLAEGYARALENGRWPSLDVLPPQERENSGQRLVIT
ncbi:MAG: hypothetical protein JKY92_05280 [Magnetovibrio sp.]|nr:hypothetical protein [Magnetovibrio sp.]